MNKLRKILTCCLIMAITVSSILSSMSVADEQLIENRVVDAAGNKTSKQRVVVSMGDSYSSGEGLDSYYGSSDPNEGDKFVEFLAHQSKNSWPGMLELPEVGKMSEHKARSFPDYSYDPNAKLQWYFVASSGAETKDILGHNKKTNGKTLKNVGQEKEYSIPKESSNLELYVRSAYFNPQISVLEYLKKQGVVPDYITLTIGGNDLGFTDIISEACKENRYYTYFLTNNLNKKLNEAQNKLDNGTKKEKSVRQKLRETYKAINDVFKDDNKKPCILVAGYPRLLDPNGKGLLIEKNEATQINKKVTYFNEAIKTMVGIARDQDRINIEYIDVETAFGTDHGAYSKNAWINEVVLIPRESDINKAIYIKRKENWLNIASAQSMHPNKDGAKCYAECFQKVINKREGVTAEAGLTPTPKPVEIKVLSDGEALKAIKNYILIELGYNQYNGAAPWYVDIDPKTNSDTAVINFRAYTGAHIYYYVNRISGETHEKVYTPDMEDGVGEGKDGATFNAWDYLNRTTAETTSETTKNSETSSSATSSAKAKPVVKVTNAEKKTINSKFYGAKFTCRIPKVSISSKKLDSINKKIKNDVKKSHKGLYDYSYYVDDSIVSIIVRLTDDADSPLTDYKIYNISVKSGKEMKDEEVIKLCKTTTKKFYAKVKKIYNNDFYKKYIKKFKYSKSEHTKYNLKHISYKYIDPYIGKNGHLCFVAKVYGVPPVDSDTLRFDTKSMKVIGNWEYTKSNKHKFI